MQPDSYASGINAAIPTNIMTSYIKGVLHPKPKKSHV